MESRPAEGGGGIAESDSPEGIQEAYVSVLQACVFAGLALPDAEDVAQEIFLWLLRSGPLLTLPAVPWLAAVARNFVRRYWRQKHVRKLREAAAVTETATLARRDNATESVDLRLSLDRVERWLQEVEAEVLRLVRDGCSFPEAVRVLGIPRGSRSLLRKRLLAHLAKRLQTPRREMPATPKCSSTRPLRLGRQRGAEERLRKPALERSEKRRTHPDECGQHLDEVAVHSAGPL